MSKSFPRGLVKKGLILATLLSAAQAFSAPDPNFHIYLAFGQSNMEGQGNIEQQDKSVDERFQIMWSADNGSCTGRTKGNWSKATPPLASCNGKLGPTDYFGRAMLESMPEGTRIGVIVVAVAGCDIQLFEKSGYQSYVSSQMGTWMGGRLTDYGGNPYGRLIDMAKKAQEVGVIKGILLHQGETNSGQQNWPSRVKGIYDEIIKDLGLGNDIPLLAGEVHPRGNCSGMNSIIAKLPQQSNNFYVVSASGINGMLNDNQNVHFDAAGYRELGKRYAAEMLKHVDVSASVASSSSEAVVESSSNEVVTVSSSSHHHHDWSQYFSSSSESMGLNSLNMGNSHLVSTKAGEFQLSLDRSEQVTVKVYTTLGKEVLDLSGNYAGTNTLILGGKLSAGRYVISVEGESFKAVKPVMVK